MSSRTTFVRATVAAAGAALAATAAALDPNAFVAGWPIEAPAGAEVFDVPLTAEIYTTAGGIEQLAVLDANGEPLSFFRRGLTPATVEQRVAIDASPVYADGAAVAPRVGIATSGRGTSVTVTPGVTDAPAITGFVLDARQHDITPVALDLDWRALPQPFLLDVTVEQSTDLTNWRRVGRASVAALSIGDSEVRHARVPVRASAGGYYRITPSAAVADWYLLRATLVSAAAEPVASATVLLAPLAAGPDDGVANAVYFDAGGSLPAAAFALGFSAGDGWVRADVAASDSLEGPWTPVAYGELLYSLSFEGHDFASTPVSLGRREARYWRVVPTAPLRGQQLELSLTLPAEQLRVAAAGTPPYLLAAGTLAEEAGPDATLQSVWAAVEPDAARVPLANVGTRRELGGPDALVAARPFPWRTASLWAVLIVGVLVVAAMAVRLAREMRNQPS